MFKCKYIKMIDNFFLSDNMVVYSIFLFKIKREIISDILEINLFLGF